MRKKLLSVALCVAMAATTFVGCGSEDKKEETTKTPAADNNESQAGENESDAPSADATSGKVYFLNFKPEIADQYTELMKKFTEETGIESKVVTAANGEYESTLKVEMAKSDAPTLFTINGPVGYASWKDYCADMKDTEFYSKLSDKGMAITEGEGVYGVPLCVETYGLICNKKIFSAYFATEGIADTGCTKIEDINTFAKLKAVVEDMQAKKDTLGIKGVFSRVALDSANNWRITNHLFCLPLYYEYQKDGVSDKAELAFSFNKEFKNIFDLYLDCATVSKDQASTGSVDDSMSEFALGEAAIAQNGVWAWGQINKDGSKVTADDLYYMPIYTGAEGEEAQGLCTGTENFVSINSQASEEDQAASAEFLKWLYTSETGKTFVSTNYGVAPFEGFDNASAAEANPLVALAVADTANTATKAVTWVTVTTPSQDWKDNFGAQLLKYAEGTMEWDAVVADAVDKWKSEKAAASEE
jgi:raffinose/stachyose/melibiose transport system substrate-binding protein